MVDASRRYLFHAGRGGQASEALHQLASLAAPEIRAALNLLNGSCLVSEPAPAPA